MSTADTLLTAIAAVVVNDVWRPYFARDPTDDRAALRTARWTTVLTAAAGLALVPLFQLFTSIYLAHATFVAAVVPPMAVALVLGFAWPRFGPRGALFTLVGGSLLVVASMIWPELITPFAQGLAPGGEGIKAHGFMRAAFGLGSSAILAVGATLILDRKAAPPDPLLVAGPEAAARAAFKGSPPKQGGAKVRLRLVLVDEAPRYAPGTDEVLVRLHPDDRVALGAEAGDLVHVAAPGFWHGGLRSLHARIDAADAPRPGELLLPQARARGAGLGKQPLVHVRLEA